MATTKPVVATCLECGKKFHSVKAAEKAAFGDAGCPKCGGADIEVGDYAREVAAANRAGR